MKIEWEKVTLGDVVKIISGNTPSKENANFWNGEFPWISAKDMKTKYLSDSILKLSKTGFDVANKAPVNSLVVLTRGMTLHTDVPICLVKKQLAFNQDVKCLIPNTTINSEYLYYYLQNNKRDLLNLVDSAGNGTGRLDSEILKDMEICFPSPEEQINISDTLSTWDSVIEKTEKLIEKKEALLNWYAKRILISGKTSKVLFSDLFKLSSEKNTLNQSYPALSVTKDGVVFQEEYFNKRVASEDTSNYLIARRNTFVFSGLNFWMGSVDLQTLTDIGIISPAYKVFTINSDLISFEYAHFLIRSNYMKKLLMDSSIVGASIVRRNLDMDNLLNSAIELPTLEQQSKIVEQLSIIQKDIELNKMLLNQYKLQKQGLMQKLLTGEWRVR